jgi:hypothetical protein
MESQLPFELSFTGRGMWRATWDEPKIQVLVAGTEDAPDPALAATLRDVVTRWPERKRAIAVFLTEREANESIRFDAPMKARLVAGDCGFDGALYFHTVAVTDRSAPVRAVVGFDTGVPDAYVSYRVVLESGEPIEISAFCS